MKAVFKKRLRRCFSVFAKASSLSLIPCPLKRAGQVIVELMLVLPVFFMMIFFIMELGNIAYQTILYHHSAYELARIGSLVAGPPGGSPSSPAQVPHALQKMKNVLKEMKISCELSATNKITGTDPQSPSHSHEDLFVTLDCDGKLIFPMSRYFLSDPPRTKGIKKIIVKVRMPIEKPIFQ